MSALPQSSIKSGERLMVEAAQLGDADAQNNLFLEAQPKLRRAAMYFLGRENPDIDDIVQETWIVAASKIQEFEFRASIFTWLNHICVNLCYKRIRKMGREISKDEESLDMLTRQAARQSFEARDEKDIKEGQRKIIKEVLKGLSSSCRQTIQWRDFDELSYGEMSKRTGLTVGAIHARVSRSRKKLKEAVEAFMRKQTEK
jgi:RNA polymerase sigma-70 factor (ECF subfamily)